MSEGPTPLWDAIDLAITAVASEPGRRVVVVFTDGFDTGSRRANFNEVVARSQADNVMIYPVGLPYLTPRTDPLRMISTPPDNRLRSLADQTGGGYVELTPKSALDAMFGRVADELHRQYRLGFVPDPSDGRMHELRVSVNRPGLHVRATQRYRAPLP
jgi:Ca-activated chloride channel family protein